MTNYRALIKSKRIKPFAAMFYVVCFSLAVFTHTRTHARTHTHIHTTTYISLGRHYLGLKFSSFEVEVKQGFDRGPTKRNQ